MRRRLALAAATAALTLTAATPALADGAGPGSYQRGPAPTATSVRDTGSFEVQQMTVPDDETPGFGAADLYMPADRSQGTFGGVVLMPGLNGTRQTLSWLAPKLASQGFVVLLVDTNTILDTPAQRGAEFGKALDYLRSTPRVNGVLDRDRLAIWGWSFAGGGALQAAAAHPELKAQVDVFPWDVHDFPSTHVPTLVMAAQLDATAPNDIFSRRLYESLPDQHDKAFVELTGAGHLRPLLPDPRLTEMTTLWLKHYVDGDTRYDALLCRSSVDKADYSAWTMLPCQG